MKLQVIRDPSANGATLGKLAINGVFECNTCEDVVREVPGKPVESWKISGETAIPRGTYIVIVDYSQRFKRELPRLLDVPGFEGIRIHPGNTAADTHGCILVGKTRSGNTVGMSRIAFDVLFDKIEGAYNRNEQISIEVM